MMRDFDFKDLREKAPSPGDNACGGPNACEGRKFDVSKPDCQDCLNSTYTDEDMS